jgi:hypothetical protein
MQTRPTELRFIPLEDNLFEHKKKLTQDGDMDGCPGAPTAAAATSATSSVHKGCTSSSTAS